MKQHLARTIVLGAVTLGVCGLAACVATAIGGLGETADTSNDNKALAAASCSGKVYQDQQPDHDMCADGAGTVNLSGVSVTATPLARDDQGAMCSQVTVANNSGNTVPFNALDWRVEDPDGGVNQDVRVSGGDLGSGDIPPEVSRGGTMCFGQVRGSGQFATIYQPAMLSPLRGVWLSHV